MRVISLVDATGKIENFLTLQKTFKVLLDEEFVVVVKYANAKRLITTTQKLHCPLYVLFFKNIWKGLIL